MVQRGITERPRNTGLCWDATFHLFLPLSQAHFGVVFEQFSLAALFIISTYTYLGKGNSVMHYDQRMVDTNKLLWLTE